VQFVLFAVGLVCEGSVGFELRRGERRPARCGTGLVGRPGGSSLERRELSYRILCATATMVRYAQFLIFFLMCCVVGSMLRIGSSLRPRYMNVPGSLRYVWVAGWESRNHEVTKNVAGVRELRGVS